jgi:hypothetical protein|tara:strand:+ start:2743 stop:3636 length:894 start_codon:yes stop_codon:yes gene_type:complete
MELTTIDTNNYAAMAKAMGIANETAGERKQASTLARLRINHSPVMGEAEVKGKTVNMEVISGGTYKLEVPDGPTYYAESVKIRPYLQRFMYKRFVRGMGDSPNRYVKTVMADNLNIDLKDNDGGFNCGKPAGYIQDFKSLPEKTQELIKQIKRVRVVLGTVELVNATDASGNPVEVDETAFIWEVDNRDAFKNLGGAFTQLAKMKRLPVQHLITANTEERKIPTGAVFYLPVVSLDVTKTLELTDKEQGMFADFMQWVQNYNEYIINAYAEKATQHDDEDDEAIVDGIVDIEVEEVA